MTPTTDSRTFSWADPARARRPSANSGILMNSGSFDLHLSNFANCGKLMSTEGSGNRSSRPRFMNRAQIDRRRPTHVWAQRIGASTLGGIRWRLLLSKSGKENPNPEPKEKIWQGNQTAGFKN